MTSGRQPEARAELQEQIQGIKADVRSMEDRIEAVRADLEKGGQALLTAKDAADLGHLQESLVYLLARLVGVQTLRDIRAKQGGHLPKSYRYQD